MMTQLIKMPTKHEDLSLIPRSHAKNSKQGIMCLLAQ